MFDFGIFRQGGMFFYSTGWYVLLFDRVVCFFMFDFGAFRKGGTLYVFLFDRVVCFFIRQGGMCFYSTGWYVFLFDRVVCFFSHFIATEVQPFNTRKQFKY